MVEWMVYCFACALCATALLAYFNEHTDDRMLVITEFLPGYATVLILIYAAFIIFSSPILLFL